MSIYVDSDERCLYSAIPGCLLLDIFCFGVFSGFRASSGRIWMFNYKNGFYWLSIFHWAYKKIGVVSHCVHLVIREAFKYVKRISTQKYTRFYLILTYLHDATTNKTSKLEISSLSLYTLFESWAYFRVFWMLWFTINCLVTLSLVKTLTLEAFIKCVFSTSDRLLSDVLLLSKVREFDHFQCISGRPWEAVGPWLAGTLWQIYLSQSGPHGLPLSASHPLGLPQFVMWSVWANQGPTASQKYTVLPGVRSASHAHWAMQSDPRGRLTDFTAKRIASPARVRSVCVRGRSVRPCGRPRVGGRIRPLTQITWLCGERPCLASHGLPPRTLRSSERPKWESDRPPMAGRPWESDPLASRTSLGPIRLLRPVEVRLARGSDSHGRPAVGGRSDSHFGLSLDLRVRGGIDYWLLIS